MVGVGLEEDGTLLGPEGSCAALRGGVWWSLWLGLAVAGIPARGASGLLGCVVLVVSVGGWSCVEN